MISLIIFLGCISHQRHHHVNIGIVDATDEQICVVQLGNDRLITIRSELCLDFKEGDVIKIVRKQ